MLCLVAVLLTYNPTNLCCCYAAAASAAIMVTIDMYHFCVCRSALEEKLRQEQRLREVELKAERRISASKKVIKLLKTKDESVQELKRQLHKEVALRQAEVKMRQAAEEELGHARDVMYKEVQRAAQEAIAKKAVQDDLHAARRQLQHFQKQRESVQQHRRHANSEMEMRKVVEEKHTRVAKELVQVRGAMLEEVQSLQQEMESLQEENKRLQGLVQAQTSLVMEVSKERDSMQGQVKELRDAVLSAKGEAECLRSKVNDTMSGKNTTGLAEMVGVSPSSMERVYKGSQRGSLTSSVLEDASLHASASWNDETRFLKRVEKTLTPVIERLCSAPKFKNGKSDVGGVAAMVLGKIARRRSSRRKLNFGGRPSGVTVELDTLLKELAAAWRHAFREHDRDTSARMLQLALKSIPKRTGRVSEWLGPR